MRRQSLREIIPVSASALAFWAWANREEVVEWGAFGVRAVIAFAQGNREDPTVEMRLRAALYEDPRTRRASGLSVAVVDGRAVLTGVVTEEARLVVLHHAERIEGVHTVDDRLETLGEPTSDTAELRPG